MTSVQQRNEVELRTGQTTQNTGHLCTNPPQRSEDSKLLTMQCGEPDFTLLVWRWYSGKVGGGSRGVQLLWPLRVLLARQQSCCHLPLTSRSRQMMDEAQGGSSRLLHAGPPPPSLPNPIPPDPTPHTHPRAPP